MRRLRTFAYTAWFYASLGVFGVPAFPFALFSARAGMAAIRMWAGSQRWFLRNICGVRTCIVGLEKLPAGPCLVAMKHQSTYDIIVPFLFLDHPAFVLKAELLRLPVFGWYARRTGMIAIDRDGGAKTMRAMLAAAKTAAEDGRPIVIFPEGTRQVVGAPADYKPGVAGLYRALGVPCAPIALNTGLTWHGEGIKEIQPGTVTFEVLPPIEPGLSREEFMARLQAAIEPAAARLATEEASRRTAALAVPAGA
jgi:1-acyl-sn-glycerol-3-phosphate acyltransferase